MNKVSEIKDNNEIDFEECVIEWANKSERTNEPTEIAAKQFHKFLNVKQPFEKWFTRAMNRCAYVHDSDDYSPLLNSETEEIDEYSISLAAARELAILSGGKKSKEALIFIRSLQENDEYRKYLHHRKEAWKLLINPVARKSFLDIEGCSNRHHDFDPRFFVNYAVKKGNFSDEQAREQRIINELIFTPDVLNKLNGVSELPPF